MCSLTRADDGASEWRHLPIDLLSRAKRVADLDVGSVQNPVLHVRSLEMVA